jgi:hypothetical protein
VTNSLLRMRTHRVYGWLDHLASDAPDRDDRANCDNGLSPVAIVNHVAPFGHSVTFVRFEDISCSPAIESTVLLSDLYGNRSSLYSPCSAPESGYLPGSAAGRKRAARKKRYVLEAESAARLQS